MWAKPSSLVERTNTVPTIEKPTSPAPGTSKKRHAPGEPTSKRRKIVTEDTHAPPTHISLEDLGGVDSVIQELQDLIVLPFLKPERFINSRRQPPRGILLHGPPGCGKTSIANAFAAKLGVPFIALSAPSIVSGMSGESEKALRDHFDEAKRMAPCLIFLDEIDAITPKRENAQREMEKRIVAQLATLMDDLALAKTGGKAVIVIAATNRPDSLDPALRRAGRFDKEINLGVPNETVRAQILRTLTRQMIVSDDVDFQHLAESTSGFVGADLSDLVSTAGSIADKRFLDTLKTPQNNASDSANVSTSVQIRELESLIKRLKEPMDAEPEAITNQDFLAALPKIQPSSKREGFTTVPDTTWADIGALGSIREKLFTRVVEPIRNPKKYRRVGITAPTGVLLWGPPGCGKTLLAKAVANESKASFISIKGPELLNKYVGESERAVRQLFIRAQSSIPCVIFFDELDALVPKRDDGLSESSARVVNTLLIELDGLSSRKGIYVIGATNRPDIIDPAMLRPGRLAKPLLVDLPAEDERVEILRTCVQTRIKKSGFEMKLTFTDELANVARSCEGFSGADLDEVLEEAGREAAKRGDDIQLQDLLTARATVRPSVGDRKKYDRLKEQWGAGV